MKPGTVPRLLLTSINKGLHQCHSNLTPEFVELRHTPHHTDKEE
jgi:hypothetical protein